MGQSKFEQLRVHLDDQISKLKKLQRVRYTTQTTLTPFKSEVSFNPPTPGKKFHHSKVVRSTLAENYAQQKCVDKVSYRRPAKLLPSVEQYLSKTEVEADPSLPTKYRDYLSSTPAIRAAMYTPFNAMTSAEVFTWSQLIESPSHHYDRIVHHLHQDHLSPIL